MGAQAAAVFTPSLNGPKECFFFSSTAQYKDLQTSCKKICQLLKKITRPLVNVQPILPLFFRRRRVFGPQSDDLTL